MSAKHALLGLLLDKPGYPYELGDRLQRRLGPSWAVNSGQLYQNVERLERDGLIERAAGIADRDGRHVFAITTKGIEEFERWFDEVTGLTRPSRRPLLVKVALAGPERLQRALQQIEAYRADRAAALEALASKRGSIDLSPGPWRAESALLHLNLTAEILQIEADLQWTGRAREVVSALLEDETAWPHSRRRQRAATVQSDEHHSARREFFARMSTRADDVDPFATRDQPGGPQLRALDTPPDEQGRPG